MSIKGLLSLAVLINRKRTIIITVILLALALLNEYAIYNIGLITGDYYKIMNEKNVTNFWNQTIKSVLLIVGMALAKCVKGFVSQWLYVGWRSNLTENLHRKYFLNLAYYRLNVLRKGNDKKIIVKNDTDNIDQRITQDVEKMCNSLSTLIPELIVSPFIIIFYSNKCFQVSGLLGPASCVIFFILSTLVNRILVKNIASKIYEQEKCEGNFRSQHFRVRNNAESIAFLSGDSTEQHESNKLLDRLISVQKQIAIRDLFLTFSINLTDYLGSILSFIALAIPLFSGKYDNLSPANLTMLISQNAFYTIYLINCFTRLIDLAVTISIFIGTMNRVLELNNELTSNLQHRSSKYLNNYKSSRDYNSDNDSTPYLTCSNVMIETPSRGSRAGRCIVKDLNLNLILKQNILITGSSGAGKTSFLRTIKHLWFESKGEINWSLNVEDPCQVMFIASTPVLTQNSLASQIVYPKIFNIEDYQNDDNFLMAVKDILHTLELSHLGDIDIFEEQQLPWSESLSHGEAQRLNLARVFYHRPKVVFIDEATNSLPIQMEQNIIKTLQSFDITVVQSGHRLSTESFQRQLHFSTNSTITDKNL